MVAVVLAISVLAYAREITMDPCIAVNQAIEKLVTAWNVDDALAFSGLFTEKAQYRGADGVLRHGRGEIETMFRETSPRIRVSIDGPVSVYRGSEMAEATFVWVSEPDEHQRRGVIKCFLVMEQHGWRIEALENTSLT